MLRLFVVLVGFLLTSCGEGDYSDNYSDWFNCAEYLSKLEQQNKTFMADKGYREARKIECDAARGKLSEHYKNISYARYNVAQDYIGFGDIGRATEMFKAAIGALTIRDSWKNKSACGAAAMAAGRLTLIESLPQGERSRFAKAAADWGNQYGTYSYAQYLENGQGVLRDIVSAYAWYNVTAAYAEGARAKEAQEAISRLDNILPIQARLEAQALSKNLEAQIESRQDCKYMVGD